MRPRFLLLLTLSLIMAAVAVFIARRLGQTQGPAPVAQVTNKVNILVAAHEIPFLGVIKDEDLKEQPVVPEDLPIELANYLTQRQDVVGKIATEALHAGIPLVRQSIRDRSAGNSLATDIRPGFRALTLRVDDVRGVAGFLLHGNVVDILASTSGQPNVPPESHVIAQALRVLAVDQEAGQNVDHPMVVRAVTLEVSPQTAEILAQAELSGELHLLLRNPEDVSLSVRVVDGPMPERQRFTLFKGNTQEPMAITECPRAERCP